MIKSLLFLLYFYSMLSSNELLHKGSIDLELGYMKHDIPQKRDSINAVKFNAELKYKKQDSITVLSLKSIYDKDDEYRRYVDVSELYFKYKFDESDILVGKNILFWGALEFHNISDVFNTKDMLDNPLEKKSKLGAWNLHYKQYIGDDELSFIVKVQQEKQKFQDENYNDEPISQDSLNRPSLYVKYSGSLEETQLDYAFLYQNGYDQQRYFTIVNNELRQNLYLVNKLLAYSTLVAGSTIYKGEISYSISDDAAVCDYVELGLGVEYTLYKLLKEYDLGILAEYFRYESLDDTKANDFNKMFEDDLTLGFRLALNDTQSSELLGGVDIDMQTDENIYFISYKTRVGDSFKLELSYHQLPTLELAKLEFGYYF